MDGLEQYLTTTIIRIAFRAIWKIDHPDTTQDSAQIVIINNIGVIKLQ
jgi:hypothetical protein